MSFAQSPYKTKVSKDAVIIGSGIGLSVFDLYFIKTSTAPTLEELNKLSRDNINSFDRTATYNWSPAAMQASDILLTASMTSPFLLLSSSTVRNNLATVSLMYAENLLLSFAVSHLSKAIFHRYRPYAYNENVPVELKLKTGTFFSFFSGHTTMAFSHAVFVSKLFTDYFPDSKWIPYVWGVNLLLSSTVGYLRFSSGAHFPTDIIVGAIVGSLVGYLIPLIHENNEDRKDVTTQFENSYRNIISFNITL